MRLKNLDRAITDEAAHGVVEVLTAPGKGRILGATIVGEHAGEMIAEYALAMRHRIGLDGILRTVHVYPTMTEGNRYPAPRVPSGPEQRARELAAGAEDHQAQRSAMMRCEFHVARESARSRCPAEYARPPWTRKRHSTPPSRPATSRR